MGCKSPTSSHQRCLFGVLLIHALVFTSRPLNAVLPILKADAEALNKPQDFRDFCNTEDSGFRALTAEQPESQRLCFTPEVISLDC